LISQYNFFAAVKFRSQLYSHILKNIATIALKNYQDILSY
jgi:hypothetical protein